MKNIYIKSAVVLTVICLVVTALLAITNTFTDPVITEYNANKVKEACFTVMPDAKDFEEIEIDDNIKALAPAVSKIFREISGSGYVFTMTTKGYSTGLVIVCGINKDGAITDIITTASQETETLGGKTKKKEYTDKYVGKTSVAEVDGWLISGATVTTTAFKNAIGEAFSAFGVVSNY